MTTAKVLPLDEILRQQSRLRGLAGARPASVLEVSTLVSMGVLAGLLTAFVQLNLRLPGHHILFAVFPMALGIALVPRRRAGLLMALSALGCTGGLHLAGVGLGGVGAMTSLLATGPLLDLALRWGRSGTRLYVAFVAAGAASNALAFVVRGAAKAFAFQGLAGGRAFGGWWPEAMATYAAAGIAAGLISAAAWFRLRERTWQSGAAGGRTPPDAG
ncbi:MAG: hypothetical protein LJF06_15615 [Gemmatimonadetes bacterium]|nr:hypothetical protein [Gemmatimonadota bacterium]